MSITVEVAYATPEKQKIISFQVEEGTTALEAVKASGITQHFSEIDLDNATLGIYSKRITADYKLLEKDRIEIYRPLIADPKEVRRRRANQAKEK